MKKPDQFSKTPQEIEYLFDTIEGYLKCPHCGHQFAFGRESGERFEKYVSSHVQSLIDVHICPTFKFSYDFSSPLTIDDQYAQARANRS